MTDEDLIEGLNGLIARLEGEGWHTYANIVQNAIDRIQDSEMSKARMIENHKQIRMDYAERGRAIVRAANIIRRFMKR